MNAIACLLLVTQALSLHAVDVNITQGTLRGKVMTSRKGRQFYAFLNIPYAKPPVGQLRFRPPEEADGWAGVLDATQDSSICTQKNIYVKNTFHILKGQEDCLYLNVYTPGLPHQEKSKNLLPVMIYFHGGGWVTGSGNSQFYPPGFLLDKDVVYVSGNYRLGPMGFLSMEDKVLPGNWGLKDQNQILKWVNQNIKQFSGDPNLVTIFGESAGGASVHYHMMSPLSRGLFHRAISQSGTALCSWSLGNPGVTRNNTIKMAELLGCPTHPTVKLVECLQSKPVEDIITQDIHFMEWFKEPMIPFKPVVEKLANSETAFLPEHPLKVVKEGRIAGVPWMTGVTSGDGGLKVAAIYNDNKLVEELDKHFNTIVPMSLFYRETATDVESVTQQIRSFYFGDRPVSNSTLTEVVNLWTDGWFLIGTHEAVQLHLEINKAPVYYYYFAYRGSRSFSGVFGDETRDFGVCHADELQYLFPMKQLDGEATLLDEKYKDMMVQMWTDFAKTGDPTPVKTPLVTLQWTPVKSQHLEFLQMDNQKIIMDTNLLSDRIQFWSQLKKNKQIIKDEL